MILSPGSDAQNTTTPVADSRSVFESACERAGVTPVDFQLIRRNDGYRFSLCRSTTITDVLRNPMYLPGVVQLYGARINGSRNSITPRIIFDNALEMIGAPADPLPDPFKTNRPLLDIFEDMQIRFQRTPLSPGTRQALDMQIRGLPEGMEEVMCILSEALLEAATLRRAAIEKLTTEERHLLIDDPLCYFFNTDDPRTIQDFNAATPRQLEIVRIARKIDLNSLFKAMRIMADAVEVTRPKLDWIHKRTIAVSNDDILLEYRSPLGPILVGGPGINRYDSDAALLVDLDGSDVYLNNAGGSFPVKGGIACLIDMGGNDMYIDTRTGVQGSGILGVGILVDYHGSDQYIGGDWSQGAAFLGAGIIYDEKGSDSYKAGVLSQGAAAFGAATAIDEDGHDFVVADSLCQGFGGTMGIGVLANIFGRDNYAAGTATAGRLTRWCGFAQGSAMGFAPDVSRQPIPGVFGGIGFLVDGHGNDTYFAPSYSQGSAVFGSVGALLDNEGHDLYDGRYHCQGAATGLSAGILVDQNGQDKYFGRELVQAVAVNQAAGFLLDYSGDDIYRQTIRNGQAYAEIPPAFALHIDYAGDDRYEGGDHSQAAVLPPDHPYALPTSIFLNHGGIDTYLLDGETRTDHRNDSSWSEFPGAIGVDTTREPAMIFANQQGPSRLLHYDMSPVAEIEPWNTTPNSQLGSRNIFQRFNALAPLVSFDKIDMDLLVKNFDLGHTEYRRLLEEGLISLLYDSSSPAGKLTSLKPLTLSADPEARRFFVELVRIYKPRSMIRDIRTLAANDDASVRALAIQTLAEMNDTESIALLQDVAGHDASPECRSAAINALAEFKSKTALPVILEALRDPALMVQFAAVHATALFHDERAVTPLETLLETQDTRLRKAAARSLVMLGVKSGIPILISSLEIRSEDNALDRNQNGLLGFLVEYTGVNLSGDPVIWDEWWRRSAANLDLPRQLTARKHFQSLYEKRQQLSGEIIAEMLERLREEYPEYQGYDSRFAPWLRQQATQMLKKQHHLRIAERYARLAFLMTPATDYCIVYVRAANACGNVTTASRILEDSLAAEPNNLKLLELKKELGL